MTLSHTNRLVHETSPYLLQHAHNPVDWYPWGEEAFAKAKQENKPILLSIGYSACHWCHVMEEESFENETIAALMNELFVNIKVDREERPDLDEIYMNAVQMLTGHGGWPMTTFLTPEGKPFYGGTYFPPEDRGGIPGFPRVLKGVAQAYREKPADVENSVDQIIAALHRMTDSRQTEREFSPDVIANCVQLLGRAYDPEHGGLGHAPKFPNAGVYELFLRHYARSKDSRAREMLTHTLTKMAQGGIYDHLGGGFHRYSVDARWLVPHFEKMLYDNAQLVRIYSHAYRATKETLYKRVVDETVGYLLREMLQPEGGFYATQDADSEGEEGKFFVWTARQLDELLGEEQAEIFCRIYDVSEEGNFEGKNILHPILTIEQASKLFRRDRSELENLVAAAKRKLFLEREKRVRPFRDEKIITSWNGLMLSGLAEALKISANPAYLAAAKRTVDFIFTRLYHDGRLYHVYKNGQAKHMAYLDDYAFLGLGLLDLYGATFERGILERAMTLSKTMLREFWDAADGAFFYTGQSHEQLISKTKPVFDASVPSGNAAATNLLLRLSYLTEDKDYSSRAEMVLRSYYDVMENQPFGFAHMLCTLDSYLHQPIEIVILGERADSGTMALLNEIQTHYLSDGAVQVVAPAGNIEQASALLKGKRQVGGKPTAYVCQNFTCSAPITTVDELRAALAS